jgi:hypothetical protein
VGNERKRGAASKYAIFSPTIESITTDLIV